MEGIIFGILRYFIVPLRGGFSFAGGSCEKSRASGKRTKGGIALGMRHTFLRRGRLKKARFSRRSLFSPFGIKSWFAGYSRVILHISCHFISVKRFSSYCWLWRSYQSTHRQNKMLVLLFLIIIHTYNFMISLLLKKNIILQRLNAIQTRDATTVFPSSI